jgi:hypothetical protein
MNRLSLLPNQVCINDTDNHLVLNDVREFSLDMIVLMYVFTGKLRALDVSNCQKVRV